MKLLILAGGFGTRLRPVVTQIPKVLAPVCNVPFLLLQIVHWKGQGINSFVFLLHHQASMIISLLKEQITGLLNDCEVKWLVEPTPLDTGGAVAFAVSQLNLTGDFLLTNADTWLERGFKEVRQATAPALAVVYLSDASRFGRVNFGFKNLVFAFQEKSCHTGAGWVSAGLCHLNAKIFRDWNQLPLSLERDIFPALVSRGELIAVPLQTDFIDIGIPDDYFRFCRWITANKKDAL